MSERRLLLISEQATEILRLRAENEKLQAALFEEKQCSERENRRKRMYYLEVRDAEKVIAELRAENEKLQEALNWFLNGAVPLGGLTRYEYEFVVEARKRAAAAALRETGDE